MQTKQKLTKKQKAFADYFMEHPKASATEAAMQTYNCKNRHVAEQIAHQNLRKVEVLTYLKPFEQLAQETILQTIWDWKDSQNPRKRELALKAAYYLHDRLYGRAAVRFEQPKTITKIAINLSGDNEEPPAEILDQLAANS